MKENASTKAKKKSKTHELVQKFLNAKEPAKSHLRKMILRIDPEWKEPK